MQKKNKCLFILPSEECVKNNRFEDIYALKNGKFLGDLCEHWNKDEHERYSFEVIFSEDDRVNTILGDPIEKNFDKIPPFDPHLVDKELEKIVVVVPKEDLFLGPEAHYEPFKRSITWEWSDELSTFSEVKKKKKKKDEKTHGVSLFHLSFESLTELFERCEVLNFSNFLFFQLHGYPSGELNDTTISEFIFRSLGSELLRALEKKSSEEEKEVKKVLQGLKEDLVEDIVSTCWKEHDCFKKDKIKKVAEKLGLSFEDNSDDDDKNIETLKTSLEGKKETETNLFGALNDFRCGGTFDENVELKGENMAHVNILFFLDRVLYTVREKFKDDKGIGFGISGDVQVVSQDINLLIKSTLNEDVKKKPDYCVYEKNKEFLLYLGEFKDGGTDSEFRVGFYECLSLANESLKKIIQKIYFEKKESNKEDYEMPFGIPILLCEVGETRKWVLLSYCIRIKEHQIGKVKISGGKIKCLGKGDDFHQSDELARLLVKSKKALEEAVTFIKDRCHVKRNYFKKVLVDECLDGDLLLTIGINTQNKIKGEYEIGRDKIANKIREKQNEHGDFDGFSPEKEIHSGVFIGNYNNEECVLKLFKCTTEYFLVKELRKDLEYVEKIKQDYVIMKKLDPVRCKSLRDLELLMLDIVDFVRIIHSKKILHLDIRPANIMMMTSNKKYRLIDFHISISMSSDENDVSNKNCGYHPIFSPPEQRGITKIEGGKLSFRSDYFSLGKTLLYFKNRISDLKEEEWKEYSTHVNNMCEGYDLEKRKKGFDFLFELLNKRREDLEKMRGKDNNSGNGGGDNGMKDEEEEEEDGEDGEGDGDDDDDNKSKFIEVHSDTKKNKNVNNHPIVCFLKSKEEDLKECLLFGVCLNELRKNSMFFHKLLNFGEGSEMDNVWKSGIMEIEDLNNLELGVYLDLILSFRSQNNNKMMIDEEEMNWNYYDQQLSFKNWIRILSHCVIYSEKMMVIAQVIENIKNEIVYSGEFDMKLLELGWMINKSISIDDVNCILTELCDGSQSKFDSYKSIIQHSSRVHKMENEDDDICGVFDGGNNNRFLEKSLGEDYYEELDIERKFKKKKIEGFWLM